jgi:hypothetical protein
VIPTVSIATSTPLASEGPDVEQGNEPAEGDSFVENNYFAAYNDYIAHNDYLAYNDWLTYCEYLANNDYVDYNNYLAAYDYWQQQVNHNFGLARVVSQGRPLWVSPHIFIGLGDTNNLQIQQPYAMGHPVALDPYSLNLLSAPGHAFVEG